MGTLGKIDGRGTRMDFHNRVAIVTGAASGIGRALCLELCRRGAIVVGADLNEQGLETLRGDVSAGAITTHQLDVTDAAAIQKVLDHTMEQHGRLDYLFNNAGIVVGGEFEDMTPEAWQRIVDVNLWGVVHGTEHGYRLMIEQGHGHIINTASTAGVLPVARSTAYAATKHAVVGLSTSLREEARKRGIRVSVAIPGLIDTNIFDAATNVGDHNYSAAIEKVPVGKISAAQAADAILAGVAKNKSHIVFPASNRAIVGLHRLAPTLMARLVNR